MPNIEIFRFFPMHTKPSKYVLQNKKRLTKNTRAILTKYSNVAYYNDACKRKEFIYYLIYVDGKYAGFLEFEPKRYYKQFYINYVYLEKQFRGKGYSKLLFNYAVNDIRQNFPNIWTISAVPAFIEGKYFLESVGFLPDIFWHSAIAPGSYSIYYLYDKHVFLLDQPEYEQLCGDVYNYKLCGVKRYVELVCQAKALDPDFSAKNYAYYLAHLKKPRKYTRKRKPTKYDGLFKSTTSAPGLNEFDIPTCDAPKFDAPTLDFSSEPSLDDIGIPSLDVPPVDTPLSGVSSLDDFGDPTFDAVTVAPEQPAVVPSIFSDEYLQTYMKYLD